MGVPGTTIQRWRDRDGRLMIELTYHYSPTPPGLFNTNPAISFINNTGFPQQIRVFFGAEQTPRLVTMPVGTGSVSRAQIVSFTGGVVDSFGNGSWTITPVNF